MHVVALYPLLLEPIYKEKVWGGRALESLGRALPGGPDTLIGESWELVDLDQTSPSGGGGGAAHSRIRNGPLQKRTMRDLMGDLGPYVMGKARPTPDAHFPLLLKYLDARSDLSVQVHPSPEYAARHADAAIKFEAWYIVAAEPDAVLYKGFAEPTTEESLRAALEDGSLPDLLEAVPARVGDIHYLPSGTCHALGKGVVVAEVQTVSDTTFRLYDWGRTDRELHIEQALECVDLEPTDASPWEVDEALEDGAVRGRRIVTAPHFDISEWRLDAGDRKAWSAERVAVLMVVGGSGSVRWADSERSEALTAGDTLLIPAALEDAFCETDGGMTILEVTLPDGPNP